MMLGTMILVHHDYKSTNEKIMFVCTKGGIKRKMVRVESQVNKRKWDGEYVTNMSLIEKKLPVPILLHLGV